MLNEYDDIDELFRRAAEGYPLNTATSQWEKVSKGLEDKTFEEESISKPRSYRSLLLLLLTLPILWICNKNPIGTSSSIAKIETPKRNGKPSSTDKINNVINKQNALIKEDVKTIPSLKKEEKLTVSKSFEPGNRFAVKVKFSQLLKAKEANTSFTKNEVKLNLMYNNIEEGDGETNKAELTLKADYFKQIDKESPINNIDKTVAQDMGNNNVNTSVINVEKKHKQGKFYTGIIVIGDLSTIKYQEVKQPGVGIGILLGYKLSRIISLETGAYIEKKFYYTSGKYFNPKRSYSQPNTSLLNAEGNCLMLEMPINLKYNFKTSAKSSWSSIAGFTSYLITNENYDYTFETSGQVGSRYIKYNEKSVNILSAINLGISYEYQLNKKATIKLEPTVKLPLRGIGYGRLPITSTGLNIGIMKGIF
jgi:hypothetical protein